MDNSLIHNTAIVSEEAKLGKGVKVGPFAIIDGGTEIGDNTEIGPRAHIISGAVIGSGNSIGEGTIVSGAPQDLKYKGEKTTVKIGNNNVIREYVVIHRAASAAGATSIGDNCFILGNAHVAHDCVIGSNVVIVNYAGLSGHVVVEDHAFVSGLTAVHQGVRIGAYSMVGGGIRLSQDVAPYMTVSGQPARFIGVNKTGLKRNGFSKEVIGRIEDAASIFFRQNLMAKEAIEKIQASIPACPEIEHFIGFVRSSKRGMLR